MQFKNHDTGQSCFRGREQRATLSEMVYKPTTCSQRGENGMQESPDGSLIPELGLIPQLAPLSVR